MQLECVFLGTNSKYIRPQKSGQGTAFVEKGEKGIWAQKSLHLKTIHIKLGMNGKRKCLKRFKGVGKNPKAEMIAPRRELCFSRGFSAEMDLGLNLVLCSAESLQFSEMVTSSIIVPALLFFLHKPICESAIKLSYPKLSVSRNNDTQQIRGN